MPRIEKFFAGTEVNDWTSGAFGGGGAAAFAVDPGSGDNRDTYPNPAGGTYHVAEFLSTGTFTVTAGASAVDMLVIGGGAGGGGGAAYNGGGGGGAGSGREVYGIAVDVLGGPAYNGVYPVTVGAAGVGGTPYNTPPAPGSVAATKGTFSGTCGIIAAGGGGGGNGAQEPNPGGNEIIFLGHGQPGGTGGGGGYAVLGGSPPQSNWQGFPGGGENNPNGRSGGNNKFKTHGGGGGGGLGGAGIDVAPLGAPTYRYKSGNGGSGWYQGITPDGSSEWVGGGGGGGGPYNNPAPLPPNVGTASSGGGAGGAYPEGAGSNGTANTGGGGGGSSGGSPGAPAHGGNGGTGIVRIRWLVV